jgi:hypothetical protein
MRNFIFGILTIVSLINLSFSFFKIDNTALDNDVVRFKPSVNLEKDFLNPPGYARARAYWWWLEGNISKEGILHDLTEMKRVGIGGAMVFDAGSSTYEGWGVTRSEAGPVFMSDEWRELFVYACRVADSLGIEVSLNMGSGWNSGGPWVTPEHASKKVVWSETRVTGPATIQQQLPLPEGLLHTYYYFYRGEYYWEPVTVLALKLTPYASDVEPLENFDLKAVHSIRIPHTNNELGFDWELFVKEEESGENDYHAKFEDIIDISDKVDAKGNILWDVPPGEWTILRFVSTGTGIRVSTHSPGGGGLAIDYLSSEAMEHHYNNIAGILLKDLRREGIKSLKYLHDDSWELGATNWTGVFPEEFEKANGYSIYKYLPVLTGKIIDNREVSNRFLYDFRRTIADLIWKNHYVKFAELSHADGLAIHSEAGGPHPAPIDGMKNLGRNIIPMGEFWIRAETHRVEPHQRMYIKQAASTAHTYGKRFVSAEGPSSIGPHWEEDFFYMKPTLDRVFCEGLNRFVIHTLTHSPEKEGKPGIEYFAGTHFNPNVTWWDQSRAFLDYTSRISFMLSQGLFTADVCIYYGDNVPNQVPLKHIRPDLGEGYDCDVTNNEVILSRMSVRDGKIILPDGMSYHVLVLPERKAIPLEVLEKIQELVKDGATVIGTVPETSVGLKNIEGAERRVRQISSELWGNIDGKTTKENSFGKGKVVWGKSIRDVLMEKGVIPDFTYKSTREYERESGSPPHHYNMDYIHRNTETADIYYIVNRNDHPDYINATFRVTGKIPELWYPETGKSVDHKIFTSDKNSTSLPLFLEPFGSVMVVFRKPSGGNQIVSLKMDGQEIFPGLPGKDIDSAPFIINDDGNLVFTNNANYNVTWSNGKEQEFELTGKLAEQTISGDWQVEFNRKWGGPEKTVFKELVLWNKHNVPGIKYYSGAAVYKKNFHLSADQLKKNHILLDLGEMYNVAEITINGQNAGVWWIKPFRNEVTRYLKADQNSIEIKVVNLWPNRLIGDQLLPEEKRFTKTNVIKFTADYPLLPSGLARPVTLYFYPDLKNDHLK